MGNMEDEGEDEERGQGGGKRTSMRMRMRGELNAGLFTYCVSFYYIFEH